MDTWPSEVKMVRMAPAPRFSMEIGGPHLATLYFSHYQRLEAVLDAARTGNALLIRLAVAYHDEKGSGE